MDVKKRRFALETERLFENAELYSKFSLPKYYYEVRTWKLKRA